jgi:hypothetical protein
MEGKEMSILEAKVVASKMSEAGLGGFGQDSKKLVNQYVQKEASRKKNIAGRRTELMQESLQEDIYQSKAGGKKSSLTKDGAKKPSGGSKPKLKF